MAEFITASPQRIDYGPDAGFNAMGKPIPTHRKEAGYRDAKAMGLDTEKAWHVIHGMSLYLERDKPYEAMAAGMRYVDLTGTYRLMAVLLTAGEPIPARRFEGV